MRNDNIEIYLSEIAERLWSGHASLMVGAGFSKNAKKGEATTKNFPSWNDLGDCLFQKLHGKIPSEKDKCYLDVLKLANEVEATFGRPALNKILRDEIPNMEYQPSELHETLLQLPWVDIFTTNYDTLLERTAEKILEQRYETVVNKEDLVWSTKPRIVKLHGSFPSERPFIITEEDYRKYPKEYAPFVNTVQQSLLENTLCLIGFSGNDPNFQKWIGWIRDNLGKENSPKIFLIGILSLSVGQKKLLEDRNIIPIDLSCYSEKDHSLALKKFVDKINEYGKKDDKLDWGENGDRYFHYRTNAENNDLNCKLNKITERWKSIRESYPNWLILPNDKRERLQMDTEDILRDIQKQNAQITIDFLYELNWRQEKCLIPIFNEWISMYEETINKYNPFPKNLQIDNAITPDYENKTIDWKIISKYWIELQLSLLRFYREESFNEKWNLLAENLAKIKNELSPELFARYCYERCLYYLFLLDIVSVRKELANWASDTSLPYWEAKKAGLIAELGDVEKADKILETSLNEIRNRLRLSPVTNDYALVSQEAYILVLARYVKYSIILSPSDIYSHEEFKKYSKRWDELKQYKCDPWGELQSFYSYLNTENFYVKTATEKYDFQIGSSSTTYHFRHGGNKYVIQSYEYLRFLEEVGVSYKLPNTNFIPDAGKKAIVCIANSSPNWGFVSLIRTGDRKIVDDIFGRKALSNLNQDICNVLATNYLEVLEKSAIEIREGKKFDNATIAISLSTVIPEILSRLCVKCSYDVKYKIFLFLKFLYLSDDINRSKYSGIKHLIHYLLDSFAEREQYNLLPELVEFPIIIEDRFYEYPDVFSFIHIQKTKGFEKVVINENTITQLISFLLEENYSTEKYLNRKIAITRLIVLWQCNLLTKEQENKFAEALWKKINDDGFPADANYYYFGFLEFPHPSNVNPQEILRKYFINAIIPQVKNKNGVIAGRQMDYPVFHNLVNASSFTYKWQKNELNELLQKTIERWNTDKEYLNQTEYHITGSIAGHAEIIFTGIMSIFSKVFAPNIELIDTKYYFQIQTLLNELSYYDMPDLEAKVSFIKIFPDIKTDVFSNIHKQLYSNNKKYIFDAINAVLFLATQNNDISMLIEDISQNIRNRTKYQLNNYINAINNILKNNSDLITNRVLEDLSIGLSYLIDEIVIIGDDSDEIIHKKLSLKQSASYLLVQLKEYYLKQKKCDIPQYIIDWETNCLDVNEFSEIRNIWLNKEFI